MPAANEFMSIGIVFAMEIESQGLKRVLAHTRRVQSKYPTQGSWQLGRIRITSAISGIGRAKCAATTEALINAGARTIINAGFAAALDDKAQVGDVIVVNRVLCADHEGPILSCDGDLTTAIPPSGSLGYNVWQSDVVTYDRIVLASEEKRAIYAATGAAALDMECHAAADLCTRKAVRFLSIKAVSDTAFEELPPELGELTEMRPGPGQLLFILKHPVLWGALWRLRKHGLKASENLGDALGMMLLRLSGP